MGAAEKKPVELEVLKFMNEEVREHRAFLEKQFKQLAWAIGVLLAVALSAFYFFVQRTEADLKSELATQVDQSAILHQINDKLRKQLQHLVEEMAGSIRSELKVDAQKAVGAVASEAVADLLESQGQESLGNLVTKAAQTEVERFAANSLQASLDCQLVFRGKASGTGTGEYIFQCPSGYDHVINANIYSAGHEQQWQSLCCRVTLQ